VLAHKDGEELLLKREVAREGFIDNKTKEQ